MPPTRFSVTLALLAIVAVMASANEVVTVQLEPPVDAARRDAAERMLKEDFPRFRSLWESYRKTVESYVLKQRAGLRYDALCDGVPIRVALRSGNVSSTTYAATEGICVSGRPVQAREYWWPVRSPDQLFDLIVELASPTRDSRLYGCVLATFDAETGIPTSIESGCPTHIDDYLTVEVADIRRNK